MQDKVAVKEIDGLLGRQELHADIPDSLISARDSDVPTGMF